MDTTPSRLGHFVLVRLAASGKPPSRAVMAQTLKPYFSCRLGLSEGQWRMLLANTLEELALAGWIEQKPYRLTASGWTWVKDFLQTDELPAEGNWLFWRNRFLMARALEIHLPNSAQLNRLAMADGLRAAVLVKHYKLPIDPLPTLAHALEILAEHVGRPQVEMHSSSLKPLDRDEWLREALIPGQLGELKACLPAFVVQARNNSVESLRQAVINRWLNGSDANEYKFLRGDLESDSLEDSPFDVNAFANRVQDLASQLESGQFGENKVFLSHLWRSYRKHPEALGMTRQQFDDYLLEANRRKLIALSRADLISEMDPRDVEDSEISLPHATFHFLRLDIVTPPSKAS